MFEWQRPVQYLKGVGPQKAKLLQKLGIETVVDLLYHFPRRYQDRTNLKKIIELRPGETETFAAIIVKVEQVRTRRGLQIIKAFIKDESGEGYAVWFNQPYLLKILKPQLKLIITGKVEDRIFLPQVLVQDFEIDEGNSSLHTGRIVPVYSATDKLSQRVLRSLVANALGYAGQLPDLFPEEFKHKYDLLPLETALRQIHFPDDKQLLRRARRRLVLTELFLLQVILIAAKEQQQHTGGICHLGSRKLLTKFFKSLPFRFTAAQGRVLGEILRDMAGPFPMQRLIQGDVGCGKTLVAAAALVQAKASGYQGTMMVPTEVLAEQHYRELTRFLGPLNIRVALLTGSTGLKEKQDILQDIATGEIDIVIGTHALIQDTVVFKSLGLVVIDEQHRFGVRQRSKLQVKGNSPDLLVMTATPIPRTLALTIYGDLDISVIDQLPPGRKAVKTFQITERARSKLYHFLRGQMREGRQVYVVCPLVAESESLDIKAAEERAKLLAQIFPEFKIGLLHGKMKPREKESIMTRFVGGEINLLVSTTVIEVGVNVPNASVMVIEDAERFGLAQLHQLRGRVGRGEYQSYCILIADPKTDEGKARMDAMVNFNDGFKIAEQDLQLRGPGEFLGTKQHGLPELRIANLVSDLALMDIARREAEHYWKNIFDVTQKKSMLCFAQEYFKLVENPEQS